jgi:hypothetical protein
MAKEKAVCSTTLLHTPYPSHGFLSRALVVYVCGQPECSGIGSGGWPLPEGQCVFVYLRSR